LQIRRSSDFPLISKLPVVVGKICRENDNEIAWARTRWVAGSDLMLVRIAKPDDAATASMVLCRSIAELCDADHRGDQSTLFRWLANKTAENVKTWIEAVNQQLVVAEESGDIVGVGAASAAGEILLNYVSPDARFRGVSKAILLHLESYVLAQGSKKSFLSGTRTAHPFYLAVGYEDAREPEVWAGMSAQPMVKWLSPERGVQ
jgi:N-acetylglutamate synthase-like GNAT family acetyltransferase